MHKSVTNKESHKSPKDHPTTMDIVESLKTIVGYIDSKVNMGNGMASIETALVEVIAEEMKDIFRQSMLKAHSSSSSNNAPSSPNNEAAEQILELKAQLKTKQEHIEILEQIVHELQTSLRVEVDKPSLLKYKSKGTSATLPTDLTVSSRESLEEVSLSDGAAEEPKSDKSTSLFGSLFRRSVPTPTKESTVAEPLTISVDSSSNTQQGGESGAAAGSAARKKLPGKRIIHFSAPSPEPAGSKNSPHPHALNDFLDY